jgi:hypothetical protein
MQLKLLTKKIYKNLVSLLFSFHIFFTAVVYYFIQFRFLLIILILPILVSFNKLILLKVLKYFLFCLVLLIHLSFQAQTILVDDFYSIIVLFLTLIILDTYKDFFFLHLNKIIYLFLMIFFIFIVYSFFSYDDYFNSVSRSCVGCFSILRIFFNENSHLALISPSVIFYLLFISKYNKYINFFVVIFFLFICFVNPSLTLYAGLILLFTFCLFFKVKFFKSQKIILILIFLFILLKSFTDNEAKTKIVDFFIKNSNINLSTEVYQISYLVAKKAIFYKPLGYGFNNYSEAFNQFSVELKFYNKQVLLLNKKDASNNFSKIVTEFGIFSLFFFYFLISFFFNKKIENNIKIFILLPIIIQTFVRGSGYFNSGFLLFVFYAFVLCMENNSKNSSLK